MKYEEFRKKQIGDDENYKRLKNMGWFDMERRAHSEPIFRAKRKHEAKEFKKENSQGLASLRRYIKKKSSKGPDEALKNKMK